MFLGVPAPEHYVPFPRISEWASENPEDADAPHDKQKKISLCITGQIRRLELRTKINRLILPLMAGGARVEVFLVLDPRNSTAYIHRRAGERIGNFTIMEGPYQSLSDTVDAFPSGVSVVFDPFVAQDFSIDPRYVSGMAQERPEASQNQTAALQGALERARSHMRQWQAMQRCWELMNNLMLPDIAIRLRDDAAILETFELPDSFGFLTDGNQAHLCYFQGFDYRPCIRQEIWTYLSSAGKSIYDDADPSELKFICERNVPPPTGGWPVQSPLPFADLKQLELHLRGHSKCHRFSNWEVQAEAAACEERLEVTRLALAQMQSEVTAQAELLEHVQQQMVELMSPPPMERSLSSKLKARCEKGLQAKAALARETAPLSVTESPANVGVSAPEVTGEQCGETSNSLEEMRALAKERMDEEKSRDEKDRIAQRRKSIECCKCAMGTKADGQYSKRSTRSKSIAVSDRGIWEGLLTEAATLSRAPDAKVLCLGRPGIGKRSLVQALHQHACPLAANTEAALKTARDPELEEARAGQDFHCPAACSVLMLEDTRSDSACSDLRTWLEILKRLTGELMQQLPLEEQDHLREEVSERLANYEEPRPRAPKLLLEPREPGPEATEPGQTEGDSKSRVSDELVLAYNLGIPLVVVVTRADTSNALELPWHGKRWCYRACAAELQKWHCKRTCAYAKRRRWCVGLDSAKEGLGLLLQRGWLQEEHCCD
eukprot:g365.t1